MRDHAGVERLAPASGSSASIEDVGDLRIRVEVQQLADFGDERGGKFGRMLGGLQRDIQFTGRASAQAHPGMGTVAMAGCRLFATSMFFSPQSYRHPSIRVEERGMKRKRFPRQRGLLAVLEPEPALAPGTQQMLVPMIATLLMEVATTEAKTVP